MRMRYKPYARPELAAWPYFSGNPKDNYGIWNKFFVNPALSLCLELGCGKGGFISALSLTENSSNFLGIDIKSEMLVAAKRTIERDYKLANKCPENVLLTAWDIEKIGEIIDTNDNVQRVYINFCNPWYKSGHAKHRLTHPRQLLQMRYFLADDGEIYFKTDDTPLYIDSLRYFSIAGFQPVWRSEDLHANEPSWNIRTEHENMFSAQGIPIKACIARKMAVENLDYAAIRKMKTI